MKNNEIYIKSPEGRHTPKIAISSLLDKYNLREFWNFTDELCDEKEFEKIAQLIVYYLKKKVEANG